MNRKLLALACLASLALSACNKPAEPAAAPPEAPKAAEPAAPAPAEPAPAAAPASFDAAALAGTFSGTLPCADCGGIDTKLELKADGGYALDETYQGKKDGNFKGDGTWTAEDNGKRVRLDPNSKSENDRLYEIVSKDEIRQLDQEGKPIDSQLNYSLKRAQ